MTITQHARLTAEIDEHLSLAGEHVVGELLEIVAYEMDYFADNPGLETERIELHKAYVAEYLATVFERCEI